MNSHGQFSRFVAKLNEARKWDHGVATWNAEYSYNDRNFSGSLNTIGKDAYKDVNVRNLLQLQRQFGIFTTKASVAHLFEQYRYFPDSEKPFHTGGKANTLIGAMQTDVSLQNNLRVNGKLEYNYVNAVGDNVGNPTRKTLAAVVLLNHQISKKLNYGINFRQEFLNGFDNPFLFSADAKIQVTDGYSLRVNGSKNYRVPTFNDFYWYAGGNVDLQPETSYQVELGQELKVGNLSADVAVYYIASKDLIKWIPGNGGLWQPVNVHNTRNFGIETVLDYHLKLSDQHIIDFNINYSYTKAEDMEKEKQLIYVPLHKANGTMQYAFRNFSFLVQTLYNGSVFTATDNSEHVERYTVYNVGAQYQLVNSKIIFGGRVKNVFNRYYENVAYRPMPSRNIEMFINFNI